MNETAYTSQPADQPESQPSRGSWRPVMRYSIWQRHQAGVPIYNGAQAIGCAYYVNAEQGSSTLANACLMAAAPDLLEALKSVRATFGDTASQCVINKRICWVMDSAIAKATRGRVLR